MKTFFLFREHFDLPEENMVTGVEPEVKTFFFLENIMSFGEKSESQDQNSFWVAISSGHK